MGYHKYNKCKVCSRRVECMSNMGGVKLCEAPIRLQLDYIKMKRRYENTWQ